MKGYYDLYLKCDVLLLADAFVKFRNNSLNNYILCPSHYLNAPALSWDAMLNMIKVEVELISDPDIFKWIDPKKFDLNKYSSDSFKGCALEVDLDYPKQLQELHNDYPLAPDKTEIKREMLSDYQLNITDIYNIPIGNVKKIVPNVLRKKVRDSL